MKTTASRFLQSRTAFVALLAIAGAAPAIDAVAAPKKADAKGGANNVTISVVPDQLKFDKEEFTVKAGAPVKLTFKNVTKTSPMPHNLVITKPGKDAEVAQAGIAAGQEAGWIPKGSPDIVAATQLIDAGKSFDLQFTAPAAGDYPFVCTFPGHNITMKGVMHSK